MCGGGGDCHTTRLLGHEEAAADVDGRDEGGARAEDVPRGVGRVVHEHEAANLQGRVLVVLVILAMVVMLLVAVVVVVSWCWWWFWWWC